MRQARAAAATLTLSQPRRLACGERQSLLFHFSGDRQSDLTAQSQGLILGRSSSFARLQSCVSLREPRAARPPAPKRARGCGPLPSPRGHFSPAPPGALRTPRLSTPRLAPQPQPSSRSTLSCRQPGVGNRAVGVQRTLALLAAGGGPCRPIVARSWALFTLLVPPPL